jgi:KaiC/GvpD/RAD55 family RecA-like ATPase
MFKEKKSTVLTIILVLQVLMHLRVATCQTVGPYFPSDYSQYGSTAYVSGGLIDLEARDGAYMTFRSYPSQFSSKTLYSHRESVTIAGSSYYLSKPDISDASGMTLSASMSSTGRKLWGKFVYPFAFVGSIPANTWTFHYRAWCSSVPADNLTRSPSQVPEIVWSNPDNAYSSDNNYGNTSLPSGHQKYSGYGIDLPTTALITKVEVGYEAYTQENERLGIRVSRDGGTNWSSVYTSPILGTVDTNSVVWIDFTSATNWDSTTLADGNFLTEVAMNNEGPPSNVFLDWLPVRVTYVNAPLLAHADVDILIRRSDGSIRQAIATEVAESELLSTVAQTNSASYSWTEYIVVDGTDYLEIDYFVDVVSANTEASAYLQVDDSTLVIVDQTRVTGVILPSEHTIEVEFTGSSNTHHWSEILLSICTTWTAPNVMVSIQLYNYTAGAYATEGTGFVTYLSSSNPDTEETENRTITENTSDFRAASGAWKAKINGVRNTISQLDLKVDLVALVTELVVPDIALVSITFDRVSVVSGELVKINVTVSNEGESPETFNVTIFCNDTELARETVFQLAPTANLTIGVDWETASFPSGTYTIRASIPPLDGEADISDNNLSGGTITVYGSHEEPTYPPQNWSWLLSAIPFILVPFGLFAWKRRKSNGRKKGFDYLNELTDGGIPDSFSILLIGEAGSGKSVWCQELTYAFLKADKSCLYVAYNNPPNEVRRSMETFHPDMSQYENKGKLNFVDCFSSVSKAPNAEKYSLSQPFSLTDLGIVMTKATTEMGRGIRILVDSTGPLLVHVSPANVIDFLLDRTMRAKGFGNTFVLSVGKETLDANLANRLKENVDCIIELDISLNQGKTIRRMHIKKMTGRNPSDAWVQFKMDRDKGIIFLP